MRKIGVVVALTLPSTSLIQHVHSHVVDSDRRMVDTVDDDNDTQYLRRNAQTRSRLIEDNNKRWSTGSSLIHEEEANTIAVNIPQSQVSHDNNGVTEDQIHKIQNKERRLLTKPKGQKQTNARRENPYQSTEKWCELFPTSIDIHCYHLYVVYISLTLISLLMHSSFTIPYLLRERLLSWKCRKRSMCPIL